MKACLSIVKRGNKIQQTGNLSHTPYFDKVTSFYAQIDEH